MPQMSEFCRHRFVGHGWVSTGGLPLLPRLMPPGSFPQDYPQALRSQCVLSYEWNKFRCGGLGHVAVSRLGHLTPCA